MATVHVLNREARLSTMPDPVDPQQADRAVVDRVLAGDVNAFEFLFNRYRGHVTAIVRRHVPGEWVAENVQDAFVRAFQSLG